MKKLCYLLLSVLLLLLVDDANAQLKLGDQPTSVQKSVILDLQGSNGRQGVWLPRISDTTNVTGIDALNPPDGVLIYHTPSAQVMIRKNGFWSSLQTTTKVGSTTSTHSTIEFQLGTAAGASKDMNYSLNSSTGVITLNIPDAAVDTRGVVTINSQTFGGLKTFNDGLTSLSTTTVSGASSNASNLYLGITSATSPGTTADRFLSVDNSGRVVLSQGIPSTRTMTINGTTYDLSANRTWSVGTVTSLTGGYGLNGGTITSSGTLSLDTTAISTRAWRQKGIDSVAGLLGNYSPSNRTLTINGTSYDLSANRTWSVGTVTSLTGGYGLNGGTITSSGTLSLDTTAISTRAWRQKGIDSVAGLLSSYVPTTRTLNGLALSSNQTFATGTSGTDFNISSSGTAHTFNIPDASATARGAVTTGTQTLAGAKTFSTGVTVSGATSNVSNLTLGITSATTPGSSTDRYLTVDATGKVVLSSVSGVSSLGAIGATPNANGASITSGVFNLQPASASFGGVVTTGTQTMAGQKTFSTGVTVSGATSNASNLTLGVTSATTPGTTTDNFLSVNSSGVVTLNAVPVTAPNGAAKIKNYTDQLDGMPNNLSANTSGLYTFTIAGANLSTNSIVYISPTQDLQTTTSINWVRVVNATTIRVSFSAGSNQQNFTPGNSSTFNITVIEF